MQIIPAEENWGQKFGEGLGSSLNLLLGTLAQQKLQQYGQRQQAARTQSALEQYGIPKEQAQAVSMMDPVMQQAYFKSYLQAPQNEAYAQAWQQLLGGDQQAPMPQTGMQALTAGQQEGMPAQQQEVTTNKVGALTVPSTGLQLKGLSKEQIEKLGPLALQKKQYEEKRALQQETQNWKKAQYYDERSKPDYEKAKGKNEAALENNMRFSRMKELIEKGQLSGPLFSSSLDTLSNGIFGFGINLASLQGADSEEFRKLSNDMIKNVREIFGNRVTNTDLEMFLKTIPTMSNTDEGKIRIINNLELFNKAAIEKYNIMNKIMEENDGMRPRDFDQQVERRYKPVQEAISKEFKRSVDDDKRIAADLKKIQTQNRKIRSKEIADLPFLENLWEKIRPI